MNHTLYVLDLLVGKIWVRPYEHIVHWNSLHHNTVLVAHQNQPLHPLLLPYIWQFVSDDVVEVEHTGNC